MKRKYGCLIVLAAALALSACGDSTCDKLGDLNSTLKDKASKCGLQVTELKWKTGSACTKAFDKCSSSEQDEVTAYVDCIDGMRSCAAGDEQAFVDAYNACANKISATNGCELLE